jgi:hypothetical protein
VRYARILVWSGDWLVVWAGCGVFQGKLEGFVVASRQGLQGLRQLVQDLGEDDSTIQNPD